jgi:hypothetical protein
MAKHTIDESEKTRAACEACYLLNWAIGDLIASAELFEITHRWEQLTPAPVRAIRVSRRMLLMSLVVIVYRLKEVREQLIVEWLLSDAELEGLGFPPIDAVMGGRNKWSYFETLRGQYAGHSFAKKATNTTPGRIVNPRVLGRALRETGLFESEDFLGRARRLVPGVESVRDELNRRYPEAKQFLKDYGSELERSASAD